MSIFINGGDDLAGYMNEMNPNLVVRPAEFWGDEFLDSLGKGDEISGDETPWQTLFEKFRLRSGEFTVWGGENNSGKSFLTSQVALGLAEQGKKSLIASFEMRPTETLQRMASQFFTIGNANQISRVQGEEFLRFAKNKIWIYNQMGRVNTDVMFAICRWSRDRLNIDHVFIDSLTMLVRGAENYSGQKDTCHELASLAKDLGIHVHLVAHTKKPSDSKQKYDKYSISGTADISNLADNVIILNNMMNEDERSLNEPDLWLKVAKQRHGRFKGSVPLFMRGDMYCFSDNNINRHVKWGSYEKYPARGNGS